MAAIELRFQQYEYLPIGERRVVQEMFTWSSQNLAMLSKKLSFTLVLACINKGTALNDEQFEQKENCNGRDTWL